MKKWDAEFVRDELGIPGCRSLIRIDKEVRHRGVVKSFDTRYLVSSLDPDTVSAKQFQELVLRHWEVENCLHLQKDRYFEEDKHVFRRPGLGDAWTVLTNMAISLTRLLHCGERTLREVHERCLTVPQATAAKLGLCRETC